MTDGVEIPGVPATGNEPANGAKLAPRLETLQEKRVAFVDWGKPNGEELFDNFQRLFADEFHVAAFDYYQKPLPSSPIPDGTIDEIAEKETDAAIFAIADCGSCNSSAVTDCITFERMDIPVVQVITDKFLEMNQTIASGRGYEKLPTVTVSHPTRYLDSEEVATMATEIYWSVYSLLTCEDCLITPGEDGRQS